MPKRKKYNARFSDGTTITRTSARAYTHAWRASAIRRSDGFRAGDFGFSGSAELAQKSAVAAERALIRDGYHSARSEIATAQTITTGVMCALGRMPSFAER